MMKKALFLDRDGIINIDHGYVYKIEDFEFQDGIFDLCKRAQDSGYIIIVVTNQSGIAREYYSEHDFYKLTDWMNSEFKKQGILLTQIYHCPHHPEFGQVTNCACRKPKPGMFKQAQQEHQINLNKSIMLGDKLSDLQAASLAGIQKRVLLDSTYVDFDVSTEVLVTRLISSLREFNFD